MYFHFYAINLIGNTYCLEFFKMDIFPKRCISIFMRSIWLEIYICRPLKQKILVGQNRSYEEQVKRREFECGIKAFLLEHCHPWSLSSCNVFKITDVLKSQSAGNCWCSANSVYWGSKLVFVPSRQTRPASKLIFVTNFLIFLMFFSIFLSLLLSCVWQSRPASKSIFVTNLQKYYRSSKHSNLKHFIYLSETSKQGVLQKL